MKEYPKIETLYDRDPQTFRVVVGQWRLPEFGYLASNTWLFTEKVDGTNIRIGWNGETIQVGGRTDDAQIPTFLLAHVESLRLAEKMRAGFAPDVTLYGEGYGARIQKGGGRYLQGGVGFVLFDVLIGGWWLQRPDVEDIASKLGLEVVPIVGEGNLHAATEMVARGFPSAWGDFPAEGLVLRPQVDLMMRGGQRVMGKLKTSDFVGAKERR